MHYMQTGSKVVHMQTMQEDHFNAVVDRGMHVRERRGKGEEEGKDGEGSLRDEGGRREGQIMSE